MIIHIDPLYKQHMEQEEFGNLCQTMVEFGVVASQYQKRLSDYEKTSLLWVTGTDGNGVEYDVLSLEFAFPDYSPCKVKFPILAIQGFTSLKLFVLYLKALDCPKAPVKESQT